MAKQPSELPQKRQRSNGNNSLIMNRSGLDLLNISTDSHMNLSQLALERQLDALRSEVQRERNARRLDKVKAEQVRSYGFDLHVRKQSKILKNIVFSLFWSNLKIQFSMTCCFHVLNEKSPHDSKFFSNYISISKMESRLKRQIQFLQEETEETRILLDNVRTQNEQDLEQMSQSRTEALQDLQDANETILQFQMQQQQQQYSNPDKNSDSLFWRQKCEYLTSELESSEQELQQLKEYNADRNNQKINNSLVDEENASISLNKSNLITHDDKSDSIMLSTAPPDVMKELHRTRVNLADTQRQHRLQSHKIKEMQKELKSAKSNLQLLASCQDKIILLERENKEFRNKQAMNEELENQWGQFRRDIEVYFNSNISSKIDNENKIHVVPSNDDDNIDKHKKHPPEIATIVRQFRNLQERLTLSQDEHYKTQALLSGSKKRVSHLESRIIEEEANVSSIQKQKEELDEKLLSCAMEIRKLKSQESISKNEVDSLRTILETFEFKPETPGKKTNLSSSSEATSRGLKLSLSRAEDKIKALSLSYDELKEKMNQTLDEKQALHTELERVKDKFGKLKDALMKEREKCENAEERAVS